MEHFKVRTFVVSDEDCRVLMEALSYAALRRDLPPEDHKRIDKLRKDLRGEGSHAA